MGQLVENARLPTPESLPGSEFSPNEPTYKSSREAYAANYYERFLDFTARRDLTSLQAVNRALDRVDPDDIVVAEAEDLLRGLKPMLDVGGGTEEALLACELVAKFQLRKPESHWMGSADVTERAATCFRGLALSLLASGAPPPPRLLFVVRSWTSLVRHARLDEHHTYPLINCALQWIFRSGSYGGGEGSGATHVSREFVKFIAAAYKQLPEKTGEQIVHDVLSVWTSRPTASSGQSMVELLLALVAASGEVSKQVWEQAVALKSRTTLESEAQLRHSKAVAVAGLISRRLIDFFWALPKSSPSRLAFQSFLAGCAAAILSPHCPAAEVFVSAFVSSLLKLANAIRSHKYAAFMFECLRAFSDVLGRVAWASDSCESSDHAPAAVLVQAAITTCLSEDQASYLASRHCALEQQPFFDIYSALTRRRAKAAGAATLSPDEWVSVLSCYPLSSYYASIAHMLCELASRGDLREQAQIDLFRALEPVLARDPALFRLEWLDRLGFEAPAVCDSLVPMVAAMYAKTDDTNLLLRLSARLSGPGAPAFKRHVLALFDAHIGESRVRPVAWLSSLAAATDADHAVASAALDCAQRWLEEWGGAELAEAMVAGTLSADSTGAESAGTESALAHRGLRLFIKSYRAQNLFEFKKLQSIVTDFVRNERLDLALVFIEGDGSFISAALVPKLAAVACDASQPKNRMLALQILANALRARPRMILPPQVASQLFSTFINLLKTARAAELDCVGSILGQLVSLGGSQTQRERGEVLEKVRQAAWRVVQTHSVAPPAAAAAAAAAAPANATSAASSASPAPKQPPLVLFRQAVMILGSSRFWPCSIESAREISHQLAAHFAGSSTQELRKELLRAVFGIATEHGALFSDPQIDGLFSNLAQGTAEAAFFTELLLKYMWAQREHAQSGAAPSHKLSEVGDGSSAYGVNLMLQKYTARLISLASKEEDATVLKVVVKAVDDCYLVADECIPVVTALSFSGKPDVSQTALRAFAALAQRWPRNFAVKFAEGIKSLGAKASAAAPPGRRVPPLKIMLNVMKSNLRPPALRAMLDQVAQLFHHSSPYPQIRLLVTGLMAAELDARDVKHLASRTEALLSGFDPGQHGPEECAKMILVLAFVLWLRRRYGIGESPHASATKAGPPEEDLEPIECDAVYETFCADEVRARECFTELWRSPGWYGSPKTSALLHARRGKRDRDGEPHCEPHCEPNREPPSLASKRAFTTPR